MEYADLSELIASEEASLDFFNSLPDNVKKRLWEKESKVTSLEKLEKAADSAMREEITGGEVTLK
ncbi:MAG: hypothetical protein PUB42_03610 [Firmicutes bacterium]|nr:hypothetical protein [Bacillota bacterium]